MLSLLLHFICIQLRLLSQLLLTLVKFSAYDCIYIKLDIIIYTYIRKGGVVDTK